MFRLGKCQFSHEIRQLYLYHYNLDIGNINFVKACNDLLFVTGTEGVKILNKDEEEEEEEEEENNSIPSSDFEVYNGLLNPNQYRLEVLKSITGGSNKLHIGSQILTPSQTTAKKYKYVISSNQLTTTDDIYFRTDCQFCCFSVRWNLQ